MIQKWYLEGGDTGGAPPASFMGFLSPPASLAYEIKLLLYRLWILRLPPPLWEKEAFPASLSYELSPSSKFLSARDEKPRSSASRTGQVWFHFH